jgi:hypothetical protein
MDLSPKIVELAREATLDADNPFDMTQRLTEFLRAAYRYQNAVKVPRGAEALEWFLFSGKAGFCNYYASAEAVMLRSLGIPARFVAGYAGGRRSDDGSQYTLLARDSHAWVEVYFPDIGWVIFEPTPLLPSVTFAESSPTAMTEQEIDPHERFALSNPQEQQNFEEFRQLQEKYAEESGAEAAEEEQRNAPLSWWLFPLVLCLLGLAGWWHFFYIPQGGATSRWMTEERLERTEMPAWLRRWARRKRGSVIEKMFARIRQVAPIVGVAPRCGETPKEFLNRFYHVIDFPEEPGRIFLDAFHQTVYGRGVVEMDREAAKDLVAIYRDMLRGVIRKKWGDCKRAVRFRLKLLRVR